MKHSVSVSASNGGLSQRHRICLPGRSQQVQSCGAKFVHFPPLWCKVKGEMTIAFPGDIILKLLLSSEGPEGSLTRPSLVIGCFDAFAGEG